MKVRKQSGVIPFSYDKQGDLRITLIKTKHKNNWGIPKGGIEDHLNAKDSALKEAFEEAGLEGYIDGASLGQYNYVKGKTGKMQNVKMFPMRVTNKLKVYDESEWRERKTFSPEKALKKLDKNQRKILKVFLDRGAYVKARK